MMVAGINHFLNPAFYVAIMPSAIPFPLEIVYLTGVLEIVLGAGLLVPHLSRWAAWGLIALLIAIFPANINMAVNTDLAPGVAPVLLWLRLPLQFMLIWWAFRYTR